MLAKNSVANLNFNILNFNIKIDYINYYFLAFKNMYMLLEI